MKKKWQILASDSLIINELSSGLQCSPVTARVMVNRKIDSVAAGTRFLEASLNHLRPPFAIKDMDVAVKRIAAAINAKEKILIFGDYDADGVTATAVLYEFFQELGTDVSYYIPHRIAEGYDLQPHHIREYAIPNHIKLIITADCGSTSYQAIQIAQDSHIDVIVCDHHKISEHLPKAIAVINPNRHDCCAGFRHLSGVGVAFCLLICLRKYLRDMNYWHNHLEPNLKSFCDLVAIGTVADIVPLIEENRIFTKTGLEIIISETRYGIHALIEESRININSTDAEDIAYRLAPRINAAGRIDHAATAVELLITKDPEQAGLIARQLNLLNIKRQNVEQKIIEDILLNLQHTPGLLGQYSLVLAHPDWHIGILGIAASKIVDRFFRPVVLISTKSGIGKGSARSIPGFDLYNGLSACADDLENFGGHAMAAGMTIKANKIDRFRKHFEDIVQQMTLPNDFVPTVFIDAELDFNDITPRLIDEIEALMPFGIGNPEPLFMAENIQILTSKIVGKKHRRMVLSQSKTPGTQTFQAIQFNIDPDRPCPENFDRIAYRLRWNRWYGKQTPQLVVEDTQPLF